MAFIFNTFMDHFGIFLIMCMASFGLSNGLDQKSPNMFNIMDFGAAGNGKKDDSQAFLKSWEAICKSSEVNETSLLIPKGTFKISKAIFNGPCKPKTINLQINGHIVAPTTITDNLDVWLKFSKVNGLHIYGNGKIDGKGSVWWKKYENLSHRPTALHFSKCDNLIVHGLTHVNSQKNHISIHDCNFVTLLKLRIQAPDDSPNTDGIDISKSTRVNIHDSFIGTGDDCVAINGGCSDINIDKVECGPGHGISIGSLGKKRSHETVKNIRVTNCTFTGTDNGARIKTWQGGSGYAKNIHFSDIILKNVNNPILIDQYYCPGNNSCKNETLAVEVSDVTFTNVSGTSRDKIAINLSCSESVPCKNIVAKRVEIKSAKPGKKIGSYCLNVYGNYSDTIPSLDKCFMPHNP